MSEPRRFTMAETEPLEGAASPVAIRLSRLITRANSGSGLMMGVAELRPGERSAVFSFAPQNDALPGEAWYGPVDETFFVVRGRLRVEWEGGAVEAGPHEAIHCPPGRKYRMVNPAEAPAFIVYAIAPAVA
jgi:mannose-6-phosphate isomerase-like protein (cupin superfamily)